MKKMLLVSVCLVLFFSVHAFSQTVKTDFFEDFNSEVDTTFWANNWAAGLISGDRDGDTFMYSTDSLNNYFLGVVLDFVNMKDMLLDLTTNPSISFLAKADSGIINDLTVDEIPIGMDLIDKAGNNIGLFYTSVNIPCDGEWHNCIFDFSSIAEQAGMDSVAKIRFNPGKHRTDGWVFFTGTVWIDDFQIGEQLAEPEVLMGYAEDFEAPVDLDFWTPNKAVHADSTPVFLNTQEEGALKVVMKQKNFYDGQFLNFTKNMNLTFDLSGNPVASIDLKLEPGATYGGVPADSVLFLISPWAPDTSGTMMRLVDSPTAWLPADGEWHTYTFDFGAKIGVPMWDGTLPSGDLSMVEALLVEIVQWPSNHEGTFWIDNFLLGDQVPEDIGDPIQFKQVPALKDKFYATWTVTPSHSPMDGATGFGKGEVGTFGDMGILVRFNSSGNIDVRNGGAYEALEDFPYEAGKEYTIKVTADVKSKTYTTEVTAEDGAPTIIGADYGFRETTPQDTLGYFGMVINELEVWGGVVGSRLNPSFMEDDYELNLVDNQAFEPQAETFTVNFNLTPTAQRLNSAISLLNGDVIMDAWGDLSAIVRCNGDNKFDARNGTAYEADTQLSYVAGTTYAVEMDVDIPAQTYSVTITPDGGSPVALATDYGFRAAADTLTTFAQLTIIGGMWGGRIGEVIVSDLTIEGTTPSAVGDDMTVPVQFALHQNYPNPFNPSTQISYQLEKAGQVKLDIISITGQVVASIVDKKQQAGNYNVKFDARSFASGVYFYRLKTDNNLAIKSMLLIK